jgi:hypothetical protein
VSDAAAPQDLGRAEALGGYALVLVLAVLLAVWGVFLVPLRIAGFPAPVSLVLAVVGNALLGRVAGQLLGRAAAGLVGVVWLLVVLQFFVVRDEGDYVVHGSSSVSLTGVAFLFLGAVTSAVTYNAVARRGS